MEQLTALKELAAKVEAGKAVFENFETIFPRLKSQQLHLATYHTAWSSYHGSLDAAHALHKAVLGDRWVWQVQDYGSPYAYVTNRERPEGDRVRGATSTTPARAWLLAIIKAKLTELENGTA